MAEAASRRVSRILAFAALVAAGYHWMAGGEYTRAALSRLGEEAAAQRTQIAAREAELVRLEAWADSLVGDAWAIERVARERYGFVRPGEIIVRFVDLEAQAPGVAGRPPRPSEPTSR